MSRVNVAIAVAEEARGRIHEVATACEALGFEHTGTLSDVGVMTGTVELGNLSKLSEVTGVLAVELEQAP